MPRGKPCIFIVILYYLLLTLVVFGCKRGIWTRLLSYTGKPDPSAGGRQLWTGYSINP